MIQNLYFMKDIIKVVKNIVMAEKFFQMESIVKVSTIHKIYLVMANITGQTELVTKENGFKIKSKEKEQ
jgi:hypothetical protein